MEIVAHYPPGEEWGDWHIQAAAKRVGNGAARDPAPFVGRVFAAQKSMCKDLGAQRAQRDSRPHYNCRSSWNAGIGTKPVMGHISFDSEKRLVQFHVKGSIPSVQAADAGVEGVIAGAGIAEVNIPLGHLRPRRRRNQKEQGGRQKKNENGENGFGDQQGMNCFLAEFPKAGLISVSTPVPITDGGMSGAVACFVTHAKNLNDQGKRHRVESGTRRQAHSHAFFSL